MLGEQQLGQRELLREMAFGSGQVLLFHAFVKLGHRLYRVLQRQ